MRPGPNDSGGVILRNHFEGHLFILEEVQEGTFSLKAFLGNCKIGVCLQIKGVEAISKVIVNFSI